MYLKSRLLIHEARYSTLEDRFEEIIHNASEKDRKNEYMRNKLRDIENRIKRTNLNLMNNNHGMRKMK